MIFIDNQLHSFLPNQEEAVPRNIISKLFIHERAMTIFAI
nr:MAG TPA_asm: hypothetical protein [Caudoviricetes sp.]